ncbi:MAG TPA: hypothetical protein VHZ30_00310, partial [Verrucomicrobiae bacterium]|nr:hypothetical protein [Verrucomicrobiae bacterium]
MKLFFRLAVSFFAALIVFILIGPGAIALKAADGTSLESRVAHLEQLAQNNPANSSINSGDNAWLLASSALVLMMT